jgi:hypothetical protein
MWNPVTIAALSGAVVAVGGVVLAIIRQLQHQADPGAHADPAARVVPAPKVAASWPPPPPTSATAPDVTGLTRGADPGKPPGVVDR